MRRQRGEGIIELVPILGFVAAIWFVGYSIYLMGAPREPQLPKENSFVLSSKTFDTRAPAIFVVKRCGRGLLLFAWMDGKLRVASAAEISTNANGILGWVGDVVAAVREAEGADTSWQVQIETLTGEACP